MPCIDNTVLTVGGYGIAHVAHEVLGNHLPSAQYIMYSTAHVCSPFDAFSWDTIATVLAETLSSEANHTACPRITLHVLYTVYCILYSEHVNWGESDSLRTADSAMIT